MLKKEKYNWIFLVLISLIGFKVLKEYVLRLNYEFAGPYTWDTTIYWTIGRGLLNGLKPYIDLFDIKPPGIYFLSALSFYLTGDVWLTNILQVLVIFLISVVPFLYFFLKNKERFDKEEKLVFYILNVVFGILISLFVAERSGEVQIESFGAAFVCLYILIIVSGKRINWWLRILLAGFLVAGAVGMKEPFLLIIIAVSLLFSDGLKKFFNDFVWPLFIGVIGGVFVLLITGIFVPFVSKYLPYMLCNHINRFGSPWVRGFDFSIVLNDLSVFSFGLKFLILFLFFCFVFIEIKKIRKISIIILTVILFKILLIIYLVNCAVGMGGEYYNHHFVFAVPFYFALMIYLVRNYFLINKNYRKIILSILLVLVGFSVFGLPKNNYKERILKIKKEDLIIRKEAVYVDNVLEKMNRQRYLFLGFNGPQLYAYTKHSPLGPIFFQSPDFFNCSKESKKDFLKALENVDLLVFNSFNLPDDLYLAVNDYIAKNFSEDPWKNLNGFSRDLPFYKIYFRKLE